MTSRSSLATSWWIGVILATWVWALPAAAAVFEVTSIGTGPDANPGDGFCDDGAGNCTLHAAIEEANQNADADQIVFAIAGAGFHTISLDGAPLPVITRPVVIDGFSQSGAQPNTQADGSDAIWQIALDGNGNEAYGLDLLVTPCGTSTPCRIRGLLVQNFAEAGIRIGLPGNVEVVGNRIEGNGRYGVLVDSIDNVIGLAAPAQRNVITANGNLQSGAGVSIHNRDNWVRNNYIGMDPSGAVAQGNAAGVELVGNDNWVASNLISGNEGAGVEISGADNTVTGNLIGVDVTGTLRRQNVTGIRISSGVGPGTGNLIGGDRPADENVIAANLGDGILIDGANGNIVLGNTIGFFGRGNGGYGISIAGNDNQIGAADPDEGNDISFNQFGGVLVNGLRNSLRTNQIFDNRPTDLNVIGIDLEGDLVTPNDAGDADAGSNQRQNFPLITSVERFSTLTRIIGSLDSTPGGTFTLDFFSSTRCDSSGFGQGEFHLGSVDIAALSGATPIDVQFVVGAIGVGFTATATDEFGNTSEFSPCFEVDTSDDADIEVRFDQQTLSANAGTTINYTVELENKGPSDATNISVIHFPGSAFSASAGVPDAGTYDGNEWAVPSLASGVTIDLVVTADIDGAAQGDFALLASADPADQIDTNRHNNESEFALEVLNGADLALTHSADRFNAFPGDRVDFTLNVTNNGPRTATDVMMSGLLPAGLDFVGPVSVDFDPATRSWTFDVGSLAEGAVEVLVLETEIAAGVALGTELTHTAATFALDPADPIDTNNLRTAEVVVGPVADIAFPGGGGVSGPHIVTTPNLIVTALPALVNLGPDVPDLAVLRVSAPALSQSSVVGSLPPNCTNPSDGLFICNFVQPAVGAILVGPDLSADLNLAGGMASWKMTLSADLPDPDETNNTLISLVLPVNDSLLRCFIATAAYGSWLDPHVVSLRAFRDEYLLTNAPGRAFVEWYYRTSPPYADAIARHIALRWLVRGALAPLVFAVEYPASAAVLGFVAAFVAFSLRRRTRHRALTIAAGGLVIFMVIGGADPAAAVPFDLAVDGAQSDLAASIDAPYPSSDQVLGAVGTGTAETVLSTHPLFGSVVSLLGPVSASIVFSDTNFALDTPAGVLLDISITGLGGTLASPALAGIAVGPGKTLFDFAGATLTLDSGTLGVTGSEFGNPIDASIDLSSSSIVFVLSANTVGSIVVSDAGGVMTMLLTLPLDESANFIGDDLSSTMSLSGNLVATGTAIPEPTTGLLIVVGLGGLATVRRTNRRRARARPSMAFTRFRDPHARRP
jgi:uncharacterized repeat protein (TIGR01451 family)